MTGPLIESWLDALLYHASDNGFGTVGVDLWVGRRSDDTILPDTAVILTPLPGKVDPTMGLGNDIERPMFNVYVRGAAEDYPATFTRAWGLWRLYRAILGRTIHGYPFLRVGSDQGQTPNSMGRDVNRRPVFTFDVETFQQQPAVEPYTYVG